MSDGTPTGDALDAAVREHVRANTDGDHVVGWMLVAGVVDADLGGKTTWLTTRDLSKYECRGLLTEADEMVVGIGKE
ncbi:hypothetical protein SEA_BLETT_3 [Microbacterium phage Blett]|nr:hypothetical protein SEA_BLETT_3 [Microbacterium phage Blett]